MVQWKKTGFRAVIKITDLPSFSFVKRRATFNLGRTQVSLRSVNRALVAGSEDGAVVRVADYKGRWFESLAWPTFSQSEESRQ